MISFELLSYQGFAAATFFQRDLGSHSLRVVAFAKLGTIPIFVLATSLFLFPIPLKILLPIWFCCKVGISWRVGCWAGIFCYKVLKCSWKVGIFLSFCRSPTWCVPCRPTWCVPCRRTWCAPCRPTWRVPCRRPWWFPWRWSWSVSCRTWPFHDPKKLQKRYFCNTFLKVIRKSYENNKKSKVQSSSFYAVLKSYKKFTYNHGLYCYL